MALNGIQIFKLTPKKNCKECGCPTCMAFSMKVAQGAMKIDSVHICLTKHWLPFLRQLLRR